MMGCEHLSNIVILNMMEMFIWYCYSEYGGIETFI
jgi:hypothetical protein